jgi:hypothetical protein
MASSRIRGTTSVALLAILSTAGCGSESGRRLDGGAAGSPGGAGGAVGGAGGDPIDGGVGGSTDGGNVTTYTLPPERVTTWQPGVTYNGGIPTTRTPCLQTSLKPLGGGQDDLPQIQKAIDTCPDDTVVQLDEGTFNLGGAGYSYLDAFIRLRRSNITLRGTIKDGKLATTLLTPCTYADDETKQCNTAIVIGTLWLHTDDAKSVDVAADVDKGDRQVTVKSNPGYQVGELVIVDEETDESLTWWSRRCSPQCLEDQKTDPDAVCDYPDCREWFIRSNRPLGQVNEIAAVAGNLLTFSAPFHMPYRTSRHAQVTRYLQDGGQRPTTRVGVEDLKVSGGGGGDGGGNIHIWGASYCWMKNVEADRSSGTSINFDGTFRCELRDSYVHSTVNPTPGGAGYGIGFNAYAADNLVENSISWNFNKVMLMRASGGGNVIGYSYFEDGWIAYDPTFVESGLNASHYATAHMELFEGNRAWNFSSDSTWGNAVYITVFRNHLPGLRAATPPLASYHYDYVNGAGQPASLYYEDLGARVGISVGENHWWNSFVGNVIGYSGMTPSSHPKSPGMGGQDRFVYEEKPGDQGVMPMWSIGFRSDGTQEPKTVSTLLRHANYDYVTKAAVYDPASPVHTLPNSLYMTKVPDFMSGYDWPWVDPDTGQTKTLPAKARFDAMPHP